MSIQHKSAHWHAATRTLTIMDDSGQVMAYERHEGISIAKARQIVAATGAMAFDVVLARRVR